MIAWISPGFSSRLIPLRIALPSTVAWRFWMVSMFDSIVPCRRGRRIHPFKRAGEAVGRSVHLIEGVVDEGGALSRIAVCRVASKNPVRLLCSATAQVGTGCAGVGVYGT